MTSSGYSPNTLKCNNFSSTGTADIPPRMNIHYRITAKYTLCSGKTRLSLMLVKIAHTVKWIWQKKTEQHRCSTSPTTFTPGNLGLMSSTSVLELLYAPGMYTLMLLEDSMTGTQPVVLNIKTIASGSRLIVSSRISFHIATTPSPTPTAVAPPGPTQRWHSCKL